MDAEPGLSWQDLQPLIGQFWILVCSRLERKQQAGRLKQWLNFLRRRYPEAEVVYLELRVSHDPHVIGQWMLRQGILQIQVPNAARSAAPDML